MCRLKYFPLIVKREVAVIIVMHDPENLYTKVSMGMDGGQEVVKEGLAVDDPDLWPIELTEEFEGVELNVQVDFDPESQSLDVLVNGENFEDFQYMETVRSTVGPGDVLALQGRI